MFVLKKHTRLRVQAKKDRHLILAIKQFKVIWMLLCRAGARTADLQWHRQDQKSGGAK